jgi:hypothetical protein
VVAFIVNLSFSGVGVAALNKIIKNMARGKSK